jgi:hypothetical protein
MKLPVRTAIPRGPSPLYAERSFRRAEKVHGEVRGDEALVYFIRPKSGQGKAPTTFMFGDQSFLGALDNDGYTCTHIDPRQWPVLAQCLRPLLSRDGGPGTGRRITPVTGLAAGLRVSMAPEPGRGAQQRSSFFPSMEHAVGLPDRGDLAADRGSVGRDPSPEFLRSLRLRHV